MAIDYNRALMRRNSNAAYISGSAVRKIDTVQPVKKAVPQVEREAERIIRRRPEIDEDKRREARERINRQNKANRINFLYMTVTISVIAVVFIACYQLLNLQAVVKSNASEVARLQTQLAEMTAANNEKELEINAGIDYEAVYDIAVNELGMVYPEYEQVITYDAGISEYVKQYGDIPNAD